MNTSDSVKNLQSFLRDISQHNSEITSVVPDGIFGVQTENSLKSFQRAYGIEPTGRADYETWTKVIEVHELLTSREVLPDAISALPRYVLPLISGAEGPYVYLLQGILTVLSGINRGFNAVDITGIFDEKTVDAIKNIQSISGIYPSGNVDKETWNALSGVYSAVTRK